jgi:phospholipid-binding lipoprotein MlaA
MFPASAKVVFQIIILLLVALGASGMSRSARALEDPFERFNQLMFDINRGLRGSGAEEVADFHKRHMPTFLRQGIRNVFINLREPITVVASFLSADFENAQTAAMRFLVNFTVGVFGFYDVAARYGWISREEDLGQIPCSYGLPEGPYLILPLYGSGTIPDMVGRVVVIVAGYQFFGRAYFPYRVLDRVVKVLNGDAGPLTGRSATYEEERQGYFRDREIECRNPGPSAQPASSP